MARIEHQCLFVGHLREQLHRKPVLRPILESRTVTAVNDELVGMLRHSLVEVVGYHKHDSRGLFRPVRIVLYVTGIYPVGWTVTVHIYAAVTLQLFGELPGQLGMQMFRNIPQCVTHCQTFLVGREDIFATGRMVDFVVVGACGGKRIAYACYYLFCECHITWL